MRKNSVPIFALLISGLMMFQGIPSTFAQTCPAGWYADSGICKANLPSTDFIVRTYPTCGGNGNNGYRIPVLPSFEPLPISTSGYYPNTSRVYDLTNTGGYNLSVKYTRGKFGAPGTIADDPAYVFDTLTRCVCIDRMSDNSRYTTNNTTILTAPDRGLEPFATGNTLPNGKPRIYPDTYEVISKQDHLASKTYNMVAYGNDYGTSLIDGRLGENFKFQGHPTISARCGCPNINENPVLNQTPDIAGEIVGYHCEPKIVTPHTGGRVLTTYNANMEDVDVINKSDDRIGSAGPVVKKILLPNQNGESIEYNRKIWTCAEPYRLIPNGANSTCAAPIQADHQCDANSAGWIDSSVTPAVDHSVGSVINKKLACCMNQNSAANFAAGARMKYDCADNSKVNYASFDELWVSKDDDSQGGQFNALMLMGARNVPSTGFYTLDGNRCNQFSELSGASVVSKRLTRNAQGVWTESASSLPGMPASTLIRPGGAVPTTITDKLTCPILVRAAMVATCPLNTALPAVQKNMNFAVSGPQKIQCPVATSIQVHVRIEQLFEIEGVPLMKTIDTIMDKRLAISTNIEKIIGDKNGTKCPRGSTKSEQSCIYQ